MHLLCRLRLHRTHTTLVPATVPGELVGTTTCARPQCPHQVTFRTRAPGYVNERICSDYDCHVDHEHAAHTSRQLRRIGEQKRDRGIASPHAR